ncbi:hypothetical protein DVH24_004313 [Malus domestica]|uniref:Uncharacterized protein n=1 Tax=Malus domestica TaxID=3750 RepID=A0A498K820_MALDO|nr:hypothetical protein DVH24_004313 [Malus domestica]
MAPKVPNLEYLSWYQQDQLVISYPMSIIFECLLYLTVGCATSHALWDCLQIHSQTSVTNEATLSFHLLDLSKGFKRILREQLEKEIPCSVDHLPSVLQCLHLVNR